MDQVAQAVSSVAAVHHTEDLTEDSRGRGLERRVERRQSGLDAPVQRFRVLKGTGQKRRVYTDVPGGAKKTRFLFSDSKIDCIK